MDGILDRESPAWWRNVKAGRIVGSGPRSPEARGQMPGVMVEGGALPKSTEREIVGQGDFTLMRHLHSVVALDQPLDVRWSMFFGGEDRAREG